MANVTPINLKQWAEGNPATVKCQTCGKRGDPKIEEFYVLRLRPYPLVCAACVESTSLLLAMSA